MGIVQRKTAPKMLKLKHPLHLRKSDRKRYGIGHIEAMIDSHAPGNKSSDGTDPFQRDSA